MTIDIRALRHRKEKLYGTLMSVFGVIGWLLILAFIAASIVGGKWQVVAVMAAEFGIFYLLYLVVGALHRAYVYGHYVMIGPQQFPHLAQMIAEGARQVGLREAPEAFVYNSGGVMNAFAMRLFGRRYLMLTSAIVDADSDEQLRFVIGHELGHHAAGHLDWFRNFIKLPAHFVPLLGSAWSRGRELTCDRVGAALSGDLESARSALQMLACGSARLNASMNRVAFEDQERLVPPVAGWFLHILSPYPRHTARVRALTAHFGRAGTEAFGGQRPYAPVLAH